MSVTRFTAQYEDSCYYCGDSIFETQDIGFVNDQIACDECCEEEEERLSAEEPSVRWFKPTTADESDGEADHGA